MPTMWGLLLLSSICLHDQVFANTGGNLVDRTNIILVTEPETQEKVDPKTPKTDPKTHDIHNLVLDMDKHSWCELQQIRQIVTHQHCKPVKRENFVCVGTCFSYTVPQTYPETPGDELLDYCDSCTASRSEWADITLDCEYDGNTYEVQKRIEIITNCSCSSCLRPAPSPRHDTITNEVFPDFSRNFPQGHLLSPTDMKRHNEIQLVETGGNKVDLTDNFRYAQVSMRDLKKEFPLSERQEKMLFGKRLLKDTASYTSNVDDDPVIGITKTVQ